MSGAKLLPCAHCGIELYACTEGWSGGTRYAHEANSCILSRKFVQGPEQEEAWNRRAAVSVVGEPVAWIPQSRWERMTAAEPWLTNIVYSEDQSKFFSCVPLYAAPSAPDGWQPDASQQWFLDRIGEEITAGRKQNALTYLSCAFAEITRRQDWQPIETAPRDGTKILAWSGFWDKHHLVRWNQGENAWCEGSWCFGSVPDMVWMPLPAPPALRGKP